MFTREEWILLLACVCADISKSKRNEQNYLKKGVDPIPAKLIHRQNRLESIRTEIERKIAEQT